MILLDLFLSKKNYTANLAKKRLQIIIKKKKQNIYNPDYFPQLKNDLLLVIAKYIKVSPNEIYIQIERNKKNVFTLEFNIPV
ncbi:cell division topological specificity factor MinE [Buchnera aphidicola]|uniref:Cell division topological specificity factor n=1 Tax=Buchnera aphidicola (Cinara cf. splendens/pseudotsugae 3390) TaxID=2518980 RepID=A0A451CXC4_9GAMM|nr:cell division topological specificity factor MinE [Buchnera aphidicola]VFP77792.1 Cell division topological specificity factor [Buchnera aphidicola (Cinara cf. splendens/pseudotsugae 3390)]